MEGWYSQYRRDAEWRWRKVEVGRTDVISIQ